MFNSPNLNLYLALIFALLTTVLGACNMGVAFFTGVISVGMFGVHAITSVMKAEAESRKR